jgi:hypothetical protein
VVDLRAVLADCVEGKMLSSRVVLRMLSIPETTENSTWDGAGRVLTDLAKGEEGRNGKLRRVVCSCWVGGYLCVLDGGRSGAVPRQDGRFWRVVARRFARGCLASRSEAERSEPKGTKGTKE